MLHIVILHVSPIEHAKPQQYIGGTTTSFNLFSVSSIEINAFVEQNYDYKQNTVKHNSVILLTFRHRTWTGVSLLSSERFLYI